MVLCSHCVILMSQFTLANACRTFRAHLSTAILRKIGSLEAYEIRQERKLSFTSLLVMTENFTETTQRIKLFGLVIGNHQTDNSLSLFCFFSFR